MFSANIGANILTGIGGVLDVARDDCGLSVQQRIDLFLNDPLINKACRFFPERMTKTGWTILCEEGNEDLGSRIAEIFLKSDLINKLGEAQTVANILGEAFIVIDYGEATQDLKTPLNFLALKKSKQLKMQINIELGLGEKKILEKGIENKKVIRIPSFGGLSSVTLPALNYAYNLQPSYLTRLWAVYRLYKEAIATICNILSRKDVLILEADLENEDDPNSLIRAISENAFNLGVVVTSPGNKLTLLSRELNGITEIIGELRSLVIAASELSEVSLFGFSSKGAGLANLIDKDRDETNSKVDSYLSSWSAIIAPLITTIVQIDGQEDAIYSLAFDRLSTPDFDPKEPGNFQTI